MGLPRLIDSAPDGNVYDYGDGPSMDANHGCCEHPDCGTPLCCEGGLCACGLEPVGYVDEDGHPFCSAVCAHPELAADIVACAEAGAATGRLLLGWES